MKKIVRMGNVEEQDRFRRDDCANMSCQERVDALIKMQSRFLRWDLNSTISRVGRLKKLGGKDVS